MQDLNNVKIICYNRKIYATQSLRSRVLYWYHFYLNHPGGSRLANTMRYVCYWKGLVAQAELFANTCKIFQQLKERKTFYGNMPPKNIAELKPWYTVHVDLIAPYIKSIRNSSQAENSFARILA